MIRHLLQYAVLLFLSYVNLSIFFQYRLNQDAVYNLQHEFKDLSFACNILEEEIDLMRRQDINLIEEKAMWLLGYAPENARILIH
ncbi:MAG: hypothetical protein H6845_02305 [Alphaproteobacteria bacterium]|nr:MAG: hypothetical protein H6845_02305 [Alphaproteobacteria bacterium]